jgi:hypothetical protein
MRSRSLLSHALLMGLMAGCIIPDTAIEVYTVQQCGSQYRASTNDASGVNGKGKQQFIEVDEQPITKTWCLSPEQAALMAFEDSWVYLELRDDIIATCKAHAAELQLGNENCIESATISASGPCPGKHAWCEPEEGESDGGEGEDEVGSPDMQPE